jgi:hypothetical protein
MSCDFGISESKPIPKSENINIKDNENKRNKDRIKDMDTYIKKDKVAFSFVQNSEKSEKNFEYLELNQPIPIPRPIAMSSKFSSSCSLFDITPISSGRSTPLQFQLETEHSVNLTEVDNKLLCKS